MGITFAFVYFALTWAYITGWGGKDGEGKDVISNWFGVVWMDIDVARRVITF